MNSAEKVAYLKGLLEGLELDKDDKETKIFYAIADVLEELAIDLEEVTIDTEEIVDVIDEIDEDLGELEEIVMDMLEEEDDHHGHHHHHGGGCGGHHHDHGHDHHGHDHDHGPIYEMMCPSCGEEIFLDEEMLMVGKMNCPGCGELLEFGLDDDMDETAPDSENV